MAAVSKPHSRRAERGVAMVEAAILMGVFFTLALGIFELARVMFLMNTAANVTRRAAAHVAVSAPAADHTAALTALAFGGIPLSVPSIDGSYFQVQYLNAAAAAVAAPASAVENLRNCAQDPQGSTGCVRYVRVRLCQPGSGDGCNPVPLVPLFPLNALAGIDIVFPTFEAVFPAGSLGYRPGMN